MDISGNLVGSAGTTSTAANDTITAGDIAGAAVWTTGDAINGGAGTDTFNVITNGNIAVPTAATVTNVETMNATSGGTVTLTATGFTGLTALNTTGVGGATVTAAATTDVSVTDTAMVTTTDAGIAINGGKNVTATLTAANATTDADPTAEIVVGAVTAAAGTVAVTLTGAYADGANNAMSNIAVTGGTTVGVTTKAGLTAAQTVAQAADTTNFTITQSAVAVTGDANTTAVTVTQDAAVAEVNSTGINGKIGIVNGAVTIADKNSASTTAAGTLTTVTLNNYGDSTINSGALNTVNLSGKGGKLGITTGSLTTPAVTTLALNVNGLAYVNAGTNNAITVDADIKTLNITSSTAASTINSLVANGATTVNVSGDAALTLTGQTLGAVTAINVTNTAGASFGTALATGVTFTGGAGADSVILSDAFTKAITMGAGNDTVTVGGTTIGTGGSVAAGDGTDTIKMTSAQAATFDDNATFNTKYTGFEVLEVSDALGAVTLNLAGINNVSTVVLAAGGAGATSILSNLASNGTVKLTADSTAFEVQVKDATFGATDVLNLNLSKAGILAAGTVTAAGVETINITAADASTATGGSAAVIHTATLTANEATKVTVSGNNGLTLTATGSTKVTTFDASGVVANGTAGQDTAANLAVTYTSLNNTAAANVTITGGAGDDVLTGGAAKDTITGGAGADTVSGGLGQDTINTGNGRDVIKVASNSDADVATSDSTTAAADVINGFVLASAITTATDLSSAANFIASKQGGSNTSLLSIDLTKDNAGAGNGNNLAVTIEANATGNGQAAGVTYEVKNGLLTLGGTGASGIDTLAEWLTEAAAVASTNGETLAFVFGSDTYVYAQNGAQDLLMQVAGVAATSLVLVGAATTADAGAILIGDIL